MEHVDKDLVEKLYDILAKNSIWDLIQTSPLYHKLIQEALQKVVPHPSKPNDIKFLQNELPSIEVKNRVDPLMITPRIYEQNIRGTLIDNGPTLNIFCVDLLVKINWDYSSI